MYRYTYTFSLIGSTRLGIRRTFGFRPLVFVMSVNFAVWARAIQSGDLLLSVGPYVVAMVVSRGVQSGDPEADG